MAKAYATDADLLALAPGLTVAEATRDAFRALAEKWIGLDAWGEKASYGHGLLTLHLLAAAPGLSGVPGSSAKVASKTIGRLSISYQSDAAPSDAELGTTSWGVMYTSLRDTIAALGATGRGGGEIVLGVTTGRWFR
jgi:hypothetical protein